jgi:molybdate transport system substrate-binding protein
VIKALALLITCVSVAACLGPGTSGPCAIQTCTNAPPPPGNLTIFAASSLKPPFDQIATQLKQQGFQITFSYAGSQTLAAQLTQGAPADVFASADTTQMKVAQNAGAIAGTPRVFVHNRLEVAVAKGNPKGIHSLSDLARPGLVVILADPSVPAGRYAQQALAKAHVSVKAASLEPQVTGVLSKVSLGEADAGIVYASDIVTNHRVDGVAIPDDQNVVADYPIAATSNAKNPSGANRFIEFVLSPSGQSALKAAGFQAA